MPGQGIDNALTHLRQAYAQPASVERDSVVMHNGNYLAEAYSGGNEELARQYIDTIKDVALRSEWPKAMGLYYRALGKLYDRRGNFREALEYYTQAIDAFKAAGDRSAYLVYTTILKAFVLNNNGLTDDCRLLLEEIQPLAEALENKNYLAWILDNYGDHSFYPAYGRIDYRQALEHYKEVEAILPGVTNMMIIADNAHGLAGCYLRLGEEQLAATYQEKALAIAKEHGLHSVIFAVYGYMADVYEGKGEFDKAIENRLLSLDYARQTDWIEMEARAQSNIAYTYKAAGEFEKALHHFEILHTIEDSLSRYDVQARYGELEAKYQAGQKDLEIEALKLRNLRLMRNVLILVLLGGLLFLAYYLWVNRKLRQQNVDLQRKNAEIQAALIQGQNQERRRMSLELHDNINAKIAATKWMLETLQSEDRPENEQNLITTLINSVTEIYEDVRFISHNLVPKDVATRSLDEIFEQLVDNLNHNQRIHFTLATTGTPPGLDEVVKMHAYSVVMELVNNVMRHSGSENATISLTCDNQSLVISVHDDGRGFDPDAAHSGMGLKNVRGRAQSLHGSMHAQPAEDRGTVITVTLPLGHHIRKQEVTH